MAPPPKAMARREPYARTPRRHPRFGSQPWGATEPGVSRPAAAMPAGGRRSTAVRAPDRPAVCGLAALTGRRCRPEAGAPRPTRWQRNCRDVTSRYARIFGSGRVLRIVIRTEVVPMPKKLRAPSSACLPAAVLLAASAALAAAPGEEASVMVDALVFDRDGNPVRDLNRSDFEIVIGGASPPCVGGAHGFRRTRAAPLRVRVQPARGRPRPSSAA